MTASDPRGGAPPGMRVLRAASRLVPEKRRDSWRREWEAEVSWAWRKLHERGRPSLVAVTRLRLRVLTCWFDALWERKQTMKMMGLTNDIRYALRGLVRFPAFTAIAVTTLALGIGVNTAVFTLVDGVLLSPLPFDDDHELVALRHQGRDGADQLGMSEGLYGFYRAESQALEELALYRSTVINLFSQGEPERVEVQVVTPGFFGILGVSPVLGRTFTETDGDPEGELVAVLSDGFWESRFARDPSVLGRTLDVNGRSTIIVGVMPPDFGHPDRDARFWLPHRIDPNRAQLAAFGTLGVGRLADGATIEALDTELAGLVSRLEEYFPEDGAAEFLRQVNLTAIPMPLRDELVGEVDDTLWILLGTVGFVLLIACANVANLLLVRAEGRQRELALRVAIGAGRAHVLRTFLSEGVVLAGAGSVLGVLIATAALKVTLARVPADLPRMAEVGLDARVLLFTLTVTGACALFFGFFPLVRSGFDNLGSQLREGGARGATGGGKEQNRLRNGLVVTQVALAMVLLVGSGLMLRSFQALRSVDPGFDSENVVTARITVPFSEIEGWEETEVFFRTLEERLSAQAGVESMGFAQGAPLTSGLPFSGFELPDRPGGESGETIFAAHNQVSAGYFETLDIGLLEGRMFEPTDGSTGYLAVIVDRSFADHWWPGESPLGRQIPFFQDGTPHTVVGVVEDVHYETLEDEPTETVYWPLTAGAEESPQPARNVDVVVRTDGAPAQFVSVIRREVQAINPRIPVSNPQTMDGVVASAMARTSFVMALLGSASAIALLLGLVGIYGVISYIVSRRTREIGVRMALGATAPSVRGMVVRQGMRIAGVGVLLGLVAAGALSRVMEGILFGVTSTDPVTYGLVAAALVAVSLVASWIPAARAAGVDPSHAIRSE